MSMENFGLWLLIGKFGLLLAMAALLWIGPYRDVANRYGTGVAIFLFIIALGVSF